MEAVIGTEVELKLVAPPAGLEKARRMLLAMPAAEPKGEAEVVSTYYDTSDLTLHKRHLTLRVRRRNGTFVQTVKVEDPEALDAFERREWEEPIAGEAPDLNAPKTGARVRDVVGGQALHPVFTTTVRRRMKSSHARRPASKRT
ncbi:MAG TPA: CYTH domain-containing protein [Alphaproteobacteria bacterium]